MKPTKQNSDRKNNSNVSAEELAYLQKKLRCYMTEDRFGSYTLDQAKEFSVAQQAAKDSLMARKLDQVKQFTPSKPGIKTALVSGFTSLNLNPETSLASLLENIGYSASSADALSKDWKSVGNDLWQSWAAIKDEHE